MLARMHVQRNGFTLVELLTSMALFTLLFSLVTVNISNVIPKENLDQTTALLISDLRAQQFKAMTGDLETASTNSSYGVYFENDAYTLFKGTTYIPSAAAVTVQLPVGMVFQNIPFDQQTVIFDSLTGEVSSLATATAQLQLVNIQANQSKTITINALGVVY